MLERTASRTSTNSSIRLTPRIKSKMPPNAATTRMATWTETEQAVTGRGDTGDEPGHERKRGEDGDACLDLPAGTTRRGT